MKIKYPKLPKVFKEKWLIALRGGEYKQCKGRLHDDGRYCCLGIACMIHRVSVSQMDDYPLKGASNQSFSNIPKYMDVIVNGKDMHTTPSQILIGMNDKGESFNKIANWIDTNL